jgi:hypothetical protein
MRYVVPIAAFLKLKQIGGNVLPPYEEHFDGVVMTPIQHVNAGVKGSHLAA